VTIAGAPGCGKSAVGRQVAVDAAGCFPDGVVVVDAVNLAGLRELEIRVLDLLACPRREGAVDTLARRRMLIVLDNVEHLVDDGARFVDTVVGACPGVAVLVTSREPLRLPYGAIWRLDPLPTPDPATWRWPAPNPAVELFARRAAQARPGFSIGGQNAPVVAALCRRLDGLPLPLELAAASLASDSLRGILRRLDDPTADIRPHRRGLPHHHRSLRDALDRSLAALRPVERLFLARLCLLPPVFDLAAARRVCVPGLGDDVDVETIVSRLVHVSLLLLVLGADEPRYRTLAVVRRMATALGAREGVLADR
jgi:predicted ATPase